MKTKEKIILQTIQLFNEHGFANVTLQNIATALDISLGNLTYHFPKKDDLVKVIYQKLTQELVLLFSAYMENPDFQKMDDRLRVFYKFQCQYKFFYVDTLEIGRAYPLIAEEHYQNINYHIELTYQNFLHNVKEGNLSNQFEPETYRSVAHKIWLLTAMWSTQNMIRGVKEDTECDMVRDAWSLLIPYFTPKGAAAYKNLKLTVAPLSS